MNNSDRWLLGGLLVLYGFAAFYLSPYYFDDSYITFRYVANLAEGHGYVYNPGEYVEGASNLLWALILVPFYWLPVSLPETAAWLGALLYGGVLVYLYRWLTDETEDNWLAVSLSLLLPLVALPIGPLWGLSGLEVGLYLLLLTIGFTTGSPISLLLAAMTRPEGVAFLVVLPLLRKSIPFKRYGFALGGWVGVGLLRWYVYGTPLPHSVTAKSGPLLESFLNGLHYLQFGVINHLGLLTVAGGLVGLFWLADRYLQLRALAVVVLQAIVVLLAGGDWMPYSRLLLPLLPVLVFGWYGLTRTEYSRYVLVALAVLILFHAMFYPRVKGYTRHLSRSVQDNIAVMEELETTMIGGLPKTMALTDLGAFGWAARDWYVIDRVGLVTPAIGGQGGGLYGNYDPKYVLDQKPTLIQTHLSGKTPSQSIRKGDDINWLTINAPMDELVKYATWKGGKALYTNERFLEEYRIRLAFRTPGNPINVFWVRKDVLQH